MYKNFHIDHAIPLVGCSTPVGKAQIIEHYALPSNFDFDDFENWLCASPGCNLLKSRTTFDSSPALPTEAALFEHDADPFFFPPYNAAGHVAPIRRQDQGEVLGDSN
jgi:hypothetical protein